MFYIDENNCIRYGKIKIQEEDAFESLIGPALVAEGRKWSKQTVTDIWNGFAGTAGPFADLKPCKCFRNRPYGLGRIWEAIQRLVPVGSASKPAAAKTRQCVHCYGSGEACVNCGGDGEGCCEESATDQCGLCGGSGRIAIEPEQSTPILDEEVKELRKKARKIVVKALRDADAKAKAAKSEVKADMGPNLVLLIKLASRKNGVSVDEAMEATGWNSCHTVRGRFSILGSQGRKIERTKHATRGTVYRLVA